MSTRDIYIVNIVLQPLDTWYFDYFLIVGLLLVGLTNNYSENLELCFIHFVYSQCN